MDALLPVPLAKDATKPSTPPAALFNVQAAISIAWLLGEYGALIPAFEERLRVLVAAACGESDWAEELEGNGDAAALHLAVATAAAKSFVQACRSLI